MKIIRTEHYAMARQVPDEIEAITTIPEWFVVATVFSVCSACGFPLVCDSIAQPALQAIRCKSNHVLVIHATCLDRLNNNVPATNPK